MRNLIRQLLTVLFLLKLGALFGQEFSYPLIKNQGQVIADFIPYNWMIKDSVRGDLNNDKAEDLAIILQYKDSATILKKKDGNIERVTTHPRILIILFQYKSLKQFELAEQTNSFILTQDESQIADPFQSIEIKKGILNFVFTVYYGTNAYSML